MQSYWWNNSNIGDKLELPSTTNSQQNQEKMPATGV